MMIEDEQNISSKDGIYLLVADKSDDFMTALRYAERLSLQNKFHIGLAYIIEEQEFQHWGNIEDRMREELRKEAEQYLFEVAGEVNKITGKKPAFYLLENKGGKAEAIINLIKEDLTIQLLLLGVDSVGGTPVHLVAFFAGKGLAQLRVPLTVVPNHLTIEEIDKIY